MKRLILALSVLLASASAAAAQQTPAGVGLSGPPVVTFVEAGRLLADPSNGVVQRSKTLVISGNQVVDIRDGFVGDPAQGRVIDLRDSFVLPGLIDSHVHLTGQQNPNSRLEEVTQSEAAQAMVGARYARRTLMAGFTTVADLGADNEAIFALREAVKAGDVPGPRIIAAGSAVSRRAGSLEKSTRPPSATTSTERIIGSASASRSSAVFITSWLASGTPSDIATSASFAMRRATVDMRAPTSSR